MRTALDVVQDMRKGLRSEGHEGWLGRELDLLLGLPHFAAMLGTFQVSIAKPEDEEPWLFKMAPKLRRGGASHDETNRHDQD